MPTPQRETDPRSPANEPRTADFVDASIDDGPLPAGQVRARALRAFSGATIVLALAMIAIGAPTSAQGPTSSFYFESELDNTLGLGNAAYITAPEWTFRPTTVFGEVRGIEAVVSGDKFTFYAAGPGGAKLTPGTYTDTRHPPEPGHPALVYGWRLLGPGCWNNDWTGEFTVHDVAYDGDDFSRLSMSFEITCLSVGDEFLRGELRYDATTPAVPKKLTRTPPTKFPTDLADLMMPGEAGDTETFTFENVGTDPIDLGGAFLRGADPTDFAIASDDCSDTTLAAGASCSIGVRMEPEQFGERSASLSLPSDTPFPAREVALEGSVLTPTTTTISARSDWTEDPQITAQVLPYPQTMPGGIPAVWFLFIDYEPLPGGLPASNWEPLRLPDSIATHTRELRPGIHQVYAELNPLGQPSPFINSRSDTITVKVLRTTRIYLTNDGDPSLTSQPPTIRAELEANDEAQFDAGTLKIEDITKGTLLGTLDLSPGNRVLTVQPQLSSGDHLIRATFSGSGGVQGTSEEYTHTVIQDVAMDATPNTFYPFVDDYRDVLRIEGRRPSGTDVSIEIRDVPGGSLVHEDQVPPGNGDFVRTWDGTVNGAAPAADELLPAGEYDVVVTFDDGGDETEVIEERITLSLDRLEWTTRQVTKPGRAYKLVGRSKNGQISRMKSQYGKGVRLFSRKGSAAVVYEFPIVKADAYGPLTFRVHGRSPNKHRALIGVWNPALGYSRLLSNYDATKIIGPRFQWWKTRTGYENRVRKNRAQAFVAVAKGLGKKGWSVFDIKQVRLTYRSGELVPGPGAAAAATSPQLARPAGTHGRPVGSRSQTLSRTPLRNLFGDPFARDTVVDVLDDPDAIDPAAVEDPLDVDAPTEPTESLEALEPTPLLEALEAPSPEVTQAPEAEPTEAPAATDTPESTAIPSPTEAPEHKGEPTPAPVVEPTASPGTTKPPEPEASATPKAEPKPTSAPDPKPEPTPEPTKAPKPPVDDEPAPAPNDEPTPAPKDEPTPEPNKPPIADAGGRYEVEEGSTVKLDGRGSRDPDGEIVSFEWTRPARLDDPTKKRPVFSAIEDGAYDIGLFVTDDDGATTRDKAKVVVSNVDPVVEPLADLTVAVGEELVLEVTFRDAGVRDEHTVRVNWGDDNTSEAVVTERRGAGSATATHIYADAGAYEVRVRVVDDDDGASTRRASVTVTVAAEGAGHATGMGT